MMHYLLWGAGSLVGLYLLVLIFSLISHGIARAILHGLRQTLSRESRALLSIQQETALYERLLAELSESEIVIENGVPVFAEHRAVVPV